MSTDFDVVVVGVGSMGSSACWYLANRGVRVLGLEQFDIVHALGSHAGQSRIIRKAYFEHPDYVPLLERSYYNWRQLERETGASIYHRTGVLYLGDATSKILEGVQRSSDLYGVKTLKASADYVRAEFPSFEIPDNFQSVFEPDAGFVTPEKAIQLYTEDAIRSGAVIKANEPVTAWREVAGKIEVTTKRGTYKAEKIIFCSGAWTSKLLSGTIDLKITRQVLAWVNPPNWSSFMLGKFPCWLVDDPELGCFYGFPIVPSKDFGGPIGLKLGRHVHGAVIDPERDSREADQNSVKDLMLFLKRYLPAASGDVLSVKTCLYSNTQDENFVIDFIPGHSKRVIVACGFSGHGFKFASVIGEVLADLSQNGKTDLPIEFLSLKRLAVGKPVA